MEPPDLVVDGGQLRLDLDDQREAVGWSKRQDVDRATLAEFSELDLDVCLPASANELVRDLTDKERVPFIEQPIDLAASPRDCAFEAGVDRREGTPEHPDRKRRQMSTLDQ